MDKEPNYGWFHMVCSALVMCSFIYVVMVLLAWVQAVYTVSP